MSPFTSSRHRRLTFFRPARRIAKVKLTNAKIEKVCDAIREGNFVATAARLSGIGRATFYEWREKGQTAREEGKKRSIYCRFLDRLEDAEAEAEVMLVEKVMQTKRGALEILKRRYRSRWGDRIATELSGPDGRPLEDAGSQNIEVNIIMDGEKEEPWNEIKDDEAEQILPPTSESPIVPLAPPPAPDQNPDGWD